METKEITIEDVTYILRKGNFKATQKVGVPMITMLKGVIKASIDQKGGKFDITAEVDPFAGVEFINSPLMDRAEKFIMDHIEAKVDGKSTLFKDDAAVEAHFNNHRSHYYTLVMEGMKFHFLDFLPAGLAFLKNINLSGLIQDQISKQTPTG